MAVLVMRFRRGAPLPADALGMHLPGGPPIAAERTVAQMLAHTAGLVSEPSGPWWERADGSRQ